MKRLLSLCFLLPLLVGRNSGPKVTLLPDSQFDTIIDGKKVALYTLKNAKGMAMQVITELEWSLYGLPIGQERCLM